MSSNNVKDHRDINQLENAMPMNCVMLSRKNESSGYLPESASVDVQSNDEAEKNLEYSHVAWAYIKPVLHHAGKEGVREPSIH